MSAFRFKISRDILYGDIKIPERFLNTIIDTYQFQLLDWRRQLGTAHLIFRNAKHSRFEHSLGVFELCKRFISSISGDERKTYFAVKNFGLTEQYEPISLLSDFDVLLAASLLHDVGSYPFCHQLERSLPSMALDHEQVGALIVRQAFKEIHFLDETDLHTLGIAGKRDVLADVINSKSKATSLLPEYVFFRDLISGPFGIDFLDYIVRDSYFCNFSLHPTVDFLLDHAVVVFDIERNIYYFGFTHHVMHELVSLAHLRLDMERKVYSNKTHKIITEMLAQAIRLATEAAKLNINELPMLTDDGLLSSLEEYPESRTFIRMIRSRKLYDVVYRFDVMKLDIDPIIRHALRVWGAKQMEDFKKIIYEALSDINVDQENILLSFPQNGGRSCKEGDILILNLERGSINRLSEIDPWIANYEKEYENLRKFLVLMPKDAPSETRDRVSTLLDRNFEDWVREIHGIKRLTRESLREKLQTLTKPKIQILKTLTEKELSAEQLGRKLKKSRTTILHHIRGLEENGFIERRKRGKEIIFYTSPDHTPYLIKVLETREENI